MATLQPAKKLSARTRMSNFVAEQFNSGLDLDQIKRAVSKRFRNDDQMVKAALEFLAFWEFSNNASITRRRAAQMVLSDDPSGVFDNLENYLAPIDDGRLLSILDVTKDEILEQVETRRPIIMGELRHINCLEDIANALPKGSSTPRSFFKKQPDKLHAIIETYYGKDQ